MTLAVRKQIVRCYRTPWIRSYASAKLRWDPVYGAALEVLRDSELPLLDIGCGIGILPFYLRLHGFAPRVVGVDRDRKKIAIARRAAAGRFDGLEFADKPASEIDTRGNVALLDVLQYAPDEEQQALLRTVRDRVAPGGAVVLRQTIRDDSWRFRLTVVEERFAVGIRWLKTDLLNFPTMDEVVAPFREAGFDVEVRPLWGRTPYNNYFFIFRPAARQRDSSGTTNA